MTGLYWDKATKQPDYSPTEGLNGTKWVNSLIKVGQRR